MTNSIIQPTTYDFMLTEGDNKTLIGLKVNTADGSIIVPMTSDDALVIGRMLVAYSDYVEQRPVRKWA
jgi:hypothetical protein